MSVPRILVVDDDPEVRRWFKTIFGPDFGLTTAESTAVARSILEKETFNVIVIDASKGEQRGTRLLQLIRNDPAYSHCAQQPVIMLTSPTNSAEIQEECWIFTSVSFVSKPLDYDTVDEALKYVLPDYYPPVH